MTSNHFYDLPEELQLMIFFLLSKQLGDLVKKIPKSFHMQIKEKDCIYSLTGYHWEIIQLSENIRLCKCPLGHRFVYIGPPIEIEILDKFGGLVEQLERQCEIHGSGPHNKLVEFLRIDHYKCKKELQLSCEENGIRWYKSWTKKQLKKALMSI